MHCSPSLFSWELYNTSSPSSLLAISKTTPDVQAFAKVISSPITEPNRTVTDHQDSLPVMTNNRMNTSLPVNLVVLRPTWMKVPTTGKQQVDCDIPCFITGDNSVEAIQRSSAVIFMLHGIKSIPFNKQKELNPNVILQSIGMDPTSVIKVGMTFESTKRFVNQFDEIDKYDIENSFRQSSDVFNPFFEARRFKLLKPVSNWSRRKSAIVFMAHNCYSTKSKGREKLVKQLQKYVKVDSVSVCLHNKEWPQDIPISDKRGLLERYKVYLAAENSIETDYVTEKIYDGLEAGAVPIYLGAPNVEEFIPTDSAIIVPANFTERDVVKIAQTVMKIFNDEAEYNRWTSFKHHDYEEWFKKKFSLTYTNRLCLICRKVIQKTTHRPHTAKIIN